jgi:hypothetical protein
MSLLSPHSDLSTCVLTSALQQALKIYLQITTIDLDITTSLITAGFEWTSSDVPSLPVLSLKIRKWLGLDQNRQWRSTSLPVCDLHRQWLDVHLSLPVLAKNCQWCWAITIGSRQEPTVITSQYKNTGAILSFLLFSIPSTEARVWAAPSIVAAALHHEASSWIWKNGSIFLL